MNELAAYLKSKKIRVIEGSASVNEQAYLAKVAGRENIKTIAEIGFNAGYSSYNFLSINPHAKVISFDIGLHACVKPAKEFIDTHFPGRHSLILGDSRQSVPAYHESHPDLTVDLMFIDGGHAYKIARADLLNCRALCRPDTIVIMDDITPWLPWGIGPTRAWREMKKAGIIIQSDLVKDGRSIKRLRPPGMRVWATGHYPKD